MLFNLNLILFLWFLSWEIIAWLWKEDEEDDQHYEIMNMRTEGFTELKKANRVYNECFTKTFMPRWFAGENVQVAEVCAS